ncbi:hypothetical protein ACFPZ0_02060 [Streptomonospora nanhaiensis]|uniref:Chaplin domain-containing protein n=1 Tax=Streptomonospora nanhaiensis TaxID=1323731 RepID=A0A853BP02_9ACTN|nr:hypothetical protein [Streptomonospora nanhaiensis]MBV2361825.1 hypothetical protein [Streptomonospora nanhaiensis]MBX9388348.1 hypothetical protein [Streptomonospora nanhaiensis]NYI96357.1 hypothetical protein [Streptomonospora nanhaiensis]
MLRKLGIAGLIAGAALGAVVAASPATAATNSGDQQYNQNLQGVPVQLCNANVSALIGVTVPVLSPQTTGDCTNGPVGTNIDTGKK